MEQGILPVFGVNESVSYERPSNESDPESELEFKITWCRHTNYRVQRADPATYVPGKVHTRMVYSIIRSKSLAESINQQLIGESNPFIEEENRCLLYKFCVESSNEMQA